MLKGLKRLLSRPRQSNRPTRSHHGPQEGGIEPIPTASREPERYKGRPLLVLLENYVLDVLGELDPTQQQSLLELTQQVFGGGNDWRLTLRTTLRLESSIDESIQELWARNQEIAREADTSLHSVQFAKMVADTNFAHLIEPTEQE